MNSNLAKVGKPTRWPPGKSGNPAGKPPGTRTAFSQGFVRDFALVWAEEGLEAVRKVAKSPEAFVAIAARICPNAIPRGMSLEDYSVMREVIAAIREGMPSADQMQPGAVFQHVLGALQNCPNNKHLWTVDGPGTQNIEIFGSPGMDAEYRKLDSRRTGGGDVRGFTAGWSRSTFRPLPFLNVVCPALRRHWPCAGDQRSPSLD
jgi:hypothetical protein